MDTEFVKPIIERLSRSLARDWPGIDREDIAQEMWANVLKGRDGIERAPEDKRAGFVGMLAAQAGRRYCATERYAYQAHTSEWIYTPAEVRELLAHHYYTASAWLETPKRPEAGAQTLLGDGVTVALWDLEAGINALGERDQTLILRAYSNGETLSAADRKALQRAVDKLTNSLNEGVAKRFNHTNHDGPGSREAMSNAAAQAATTRNYTD